MCILAHLAAKGGTVRIRLVTPLVCLVAVTGIIAPASAAGVETRLVSRFQGIDAVHGNSSTFGHVLSGNGRFVVFTADDDGLPGTDSTRDVYVRDRMVGHTELVSKNSAGEPADGNSNDSVAISQNGRFAAFSVDADNLPGGIDTEDVYVRDLDSDKTVLVSRTSAEAVLDDASDQPSVSSGGRFVAFHSNADLLPGDDSVGNVYVRDRKNGITRLVSKNSAGTPATGESSVPSISADGNKVSFQSRANNLPGPDDQARVFVHNFQTATTRLVSKTSSGDPLDAGSFPSAGAMSANGMFVVFESDATNPPGDDTVTDVYLHDLLTGMTRLMSKSSAGSPGDADSVGPSVSGNGRFVTFESDADNLGGGASGFIDVFLHDRETGTTRLISRATSGATGLEDSFYPTVSADGRFVAFSSRSDNFSTVDDNDVTNAFVRGPLG
jgi:Tol biopolymer transport system component